MAQNRSSEGTTNHKSEGLCQTSSYYSESVNYPADPCDDYSEDGDYHGGWYELTQEDH